MTFSGDDRDKLHWLCRRGTLSEVKNFVEGLDDETFENRLSSGRGLLGYTPLHEAVANGKADILQYLLERTGDAHVNCISMEGFTPLYLASGYGNMECVKTLLDHNADFSITDSYGKTPRQIAKKPSIVRLLLSEGQCCKCLPKVFVCFLLLLL